MKVSVFKVPEKPKENKVKDQAESKVKLKKGETILTLIETARHLVETKLADYKDTSECVIEEEQLIKFFEETPENGLIALDTETTGLNVLTDKLVGISVCNGKQALYIPINHISVATKQRLPNQIPEQRIKDIFGNVFKNRNFKYIYHNAKFDLGVLRTFFGYPIPDPYWDTMLAANLLFQDEEHNLKYLYNKYVATEEDGVNRFDTLFKGITFDYIPINICGI